MRSGTILAKVCWVIIHLGPVELFKRAWRYFKNYKIKWLLVYRNKIHAYRIWLESENKIVDAKLFSAQHDIERFSYNPLISIVMPVSYLSQVAYLEDSIKSIINQAYPSWEFCIANSISQDKHVEEILNKYSEKDCRFKVVNLTNPSGVVNTGNKTLLLATGDYVGFLNCSDVLAPHSLLEVVKLINNNPDIDIIYSDEDQLIDENTRSNPFFKPDWSPDLLLSMNYINNFLLVRRQFIQKAGGFRDGTDGCQYYDLVLRLTERTKKIAHIPEILYHSRSPLTPAFNVQDAKKVEIYSGLEAIEVALTRCGIKGMVSQTGAGCYRVKYQVQDESLISIIIPVRDRIRLLRRCINSIQEKSTYRNYEIIVVDNGSVEADSLTYFKELQYFENYRVLLYDRPFNYSKINNFASQQARGEYLLFLNNDTEVISPDWLEEMLSHCQRPKIGAVGVKLIFPDNRIQHGGVIVGLRRAAMHAFYGIPIEDSGYMEMATVIRNYSAVTAACLMIRKNVFNEVGGFDEELSVAYNDVDLCLKVLEKEYFIIWTPYALLYHYESASRGQYYPEDNINYFCNKWRVFLERGDPFYNPNLNLNYSDFRVKI